MKKSVKLRIKKDFNDTKNERLEIFALDSDTEMNKQKQTFNSWINDEQKWHKDVLDKLLSAIDDESSKLKDLKDELAEVERDY